MKINRSVVYTEIVEKVCATCIVQSEVINKPAPIILCSVFKLESLYISTKEKLKHGSVRNSCFNWSSSHIFKKLCLRRKSIFQQKQNTKILISLICIPVMIKAFCNKVYDKIIRNKKSEAVFITAFWHKISHRTFSSERIIFQNKLIV